MRDPWKRGLRVVGYAVMALAIAHCGDNNNNNDNGGGHTPGTRTATPAVTSTPGATSGTPVETTAAVTPTTATSPGSSCPAAIAVVGNAATARLDSGWTGLAHNAKIIDRGEATVSTDCGGNPRPCGVCNLSGPIPNPDVNNGVSDNHRCTNNTSVTCTDDSACTQMCLGGSNDGHTCAAVGDCPNGLCPKAGTCAFFFGAPLPLAAGGVSSCVVNQIIGTITGTANIETGDAASSVRLTSTVFLGPTLDAPCGSCEGDTTPADGQKNGSCLGGARDGLTCDVGGASPTFLSHGTTSFDCPSLPGSKIGGLPIALDNRTGSTTLTLTNDNPNCRSGSGKCFCDTCGNPAASPCTSNADCAGAICGGLRCQGGPNTGHACTTAGANAAECGMNSSGTPVACGIPGQPSQPNQCNPGSTCVPDSAGSTNGHCDPLPSDMYCKPHEGFRSCEVDSDCGFAGDTCSDNRPRPCFLDNGAVGGSVTAFGAAEVPVDGVSHPTLSSLFCIPPTSSSAVNGAAGLPGLGRLSLPATAREIASTP